MEQVPTDSSVTGRGGGGWGGGVWRLAAPQLPISVLGRLFLIRSISECSIYTKIYIFKGLKYCFIYTRNFFVVVSKFDIILTHMHHKNAPLFSLSYKQIKR